MKILVVGLGSIAKRHVRNIKQIIPDATITVLHTHSRKNTSTDSIYGIDRSVYSFDDAINTKPDVAFITNPSSDHISVAKILAEKGIDLFIEKPLSSELSGIDELLTIAKKQQSLIMVGYNFRFHLPLRLMKKEIDNNTIGKLISIRAEVGQYLPDWRPGMDYRKSVSARKDLGGGAVLELSHELDYVRWLAGEVQSVSAYVDRISNLHIDVEDTAEIILRFVNGAIGSVHLDMVQRFPLRICRVIGTEGTLLWDGSDDSVKCFLAKTQEWSLLYPAGNMDRNEMYIAELTHFLQCVKDRKSPAVDGSDGKRVVEIALAVLQSAREQRSVML